MTSPGLEPTPQHEGLAKMAMMMLRIDPAAALAEQLPELSSSSNLPTEDWDKLFHAVESRLSRSVATVDQTPDKTRVIVLECVEALNKLHHALKHERQQRHQPA